MRSALAIVFGLAVTVLVLEVARNSERVIAWVLSAAAIAALVAPMVEGLARIRFVPRAVAVIITALVLLGSIGFVGYRIVDDVSSATSSLQQAAPARAAELERSSDFWREIKLKQRVTRLVNEVPRRFAGGAPTQAIKSAATRGVAFLAGTILTVFFVLYGRRLVDGAFGLIDDPRRRERVEHIVDTASRRALFYARVKLWESIVEGLLAFTIARLAGVPGPAALGVWVAIWSLLPVAGVLIGALPIIVFAGAHSMTRAIVVALGFVVVGVLDALVNRWLDRTSLYVGPFVIVLAAFGGLELYGLSGALLLVLGAVFVVAVVREIGLEQVGEVIAAPLVGAPADDAVAPSGPPPG